MHMKQAVKKVLSGFVGNSKTLEIADKILNSIRITTDDAMYLFQHVELAVLGILADYVRVSKNGNNVWYNRNFHIEPTNICIYSCKFCSYSRKQGDADAWTLSIDDIITEVEKQKKNSPTEVHIVGGVHPLYDLEYYGKIIRQIKQTTPDIHVKAFTAVELDYLFKKAKLSIADGFRKLKSFGLDSMPGGGAEIFATEIRKHICNDKSTAEMWLSIHEEAHKNGVPTNATILYGHIENYEHRIDHLNRLRILQDKTSGFNAFIPLKYRKANNLMSKIGEVNIVEDLKMFAISRIFLDNFDHIKAYWPMIGKKNTELLLSFGVDDIDGTIHDSTKIYSMAGANDRKPILTIGEIEKMAVQSGRVAHERDSLYNVV